MSGGMPNCLRCWGTGVEPSAQTHVIYPCRECDAWTEYGNVRIRFWPVLP